MTIRTRFILVTTAIILIAMTVSCWFIYQQQARVFEEHTRDTTTLVSNFTLASRAYVKEVLRPALQKEVDGFIVEGMSGTFVTRGITEMLNRKMPDYRYRQPTFNPLNPINRPDDFELEILNRLKHSAAEELSGYRTVDGHETFSIARPILMEEKCLRCHGNPADAPAEIIAHYGSENGFGWAVGETVGATLITIPTTKLRAAQVAQIQRIVIIFLTLFVILLGAIYILFERLFNQPIRTTTEVMEQVAVDPLSSRRLPESAHGEFGVMASAFNRMAETITRHRESLEKTVVDRTAALTAEIAERQKAEEKANRFDRVLESSLNEIYIFDAETFAFIEVNCGARNNLGYTMAELHNLTPLDLKPKITVEDFAEIIEPLRTGQRETVHFNTIHQRKDGSCYPVDIYLQLMKNRTPVYVAIVLDITERKKVENEMRKLSAAVEQSPASVVITDLEGQIQYVNPKFVELTGYSAEEAIGQNPRILQSGERSHEDYELLWNTIRAGETWRGEFHNRKKSGELYWEAASISPIRNEENIITNFLAVKEDITERKEAERLLEIAATTDKLTGLPNRKTFLDRLDQIMKQSRRGDNLFAVLFFDFDRFKVVNDSLGHDVGDALLCDIAEIFRRELRETDLVGRFGGDEFVVLLNNLKDESDAHLKAQRLLQIFAEPHLLGDHRVVSTASIGLVTSARTYQTAGEMIRDADAAMYQAKDAGKGRVVTFGQAMHEKAMDRLVLENDLRSALTDNQLRLLYQPIIELNTGELSGFEALIRWEHPERGLVSPADFIPIAEDTGLIVEIGRWVLHTAAAQIAEWNHKFGTDRPLVMNVNVSKRQLLHSSFVDEILECKREYGLDSKELKLEITESAIVDDRSSIVALLHQLRDLGFAIVMDDFGTGVSSLGTLHDYPIDVLKIDQSFIRAIDNNRPLLAIVASITSLAENLGITTVAEGIETESIVSAMQSIDCTFGQGYHFAKPLTPSDAESYIREKQGKRQAA